MQNSACFLFPWKLNLGRVSICQVSPVSIPRRCIFHIRGDPLEVNDPPVKVTTGAEKQSTDRSGISFLPNLSNLIHAPWIPTQRKPLLTYIKDGNPSCCILALRLHDTRKKQHQFRENRYTDKCSRKQLLETDKTRNTRTLHRSRQLQIYISVEFKAVPPTPISIPTFSSDRSVF